jgi:hypothetical protein
MKAIRAIAMEIMGLFVDEGGIALPALVLIAAITLAAKLTALPPREGGILLLIGCIAILVWSVRRAAAHRK